MGFDEGRHRRDRDGRFAEKPGGEVSGEQVDSLRAAADGLAAPCDPDAEVAATMGANPAVVRAIAGALQEARDVQERQGHDLGPWENATSSDEEGSTAAAACEACGDGFVVSFDAAGAVLGSTRDATPCEELADDDEDRLNESMDGDHESAFVSIGWGPDEAYGGDGEW